MSIIARQETLSMFAAIGSPLAFRANRTHAQSRDVCPPFPNSLLQPFIETLVACPCAAAAPGVCLVGTKAQVWSAYPRLPKSNRMLGELSQAVCKETDTPLLILLNGAGAALFEPHRRPQRILPMSAYERFGPNCSFGLSLEQAIRLLDAKPKPSETLETLVRRVISGAKSSDLGI